MAAMIRANPSTAAVRGSFAKRPASCHGSMPRRASAERTLSVIPLASTPTSANKNPFRSERCSAFASVFATIQHHLFPDSYLALYYCNDSIFL